MTLSRYQPWGLLSELQNDINRSFARYSDNDSETSSSSMIRYDWIPPVDVHEEQDRYVVAADLPGVDPKSVEITAERGSLVLKGERNVEKPAEGDYSRRSERAHGQFYRRFSLPEAADVEHISAKGQNGVLEIVIPKAEQAKPRAIKVDVR